MQTLIFNKPNNLDFLHDELIAGVPGFHRTVDLLDDLAAADDCGAVQSSGESIKITFADDNPGHLIETAVLAHDSIIPRPDVRVERRTRMSELLQISRSDWSAAQFRELLQLTAQELLA